MPVFGADGVSSLAYSPDEVVMVLALAGTAALSLAPWVGLLIAVTLLLVVGMTLFARTFLSGYSTPVGQIALLAVVAIFATSLRWMRRLSEPVKPPRVLFDPAPAPVNQ